MKVRFQADANLNEIVISALLQREPAIDFQTAPAAGLAGLPDPQVLAVAAAAGRVLVTHDRKSMPYHFSEFVAAHTCAGVVIVPQYLPVPLAVDELLLVWTATEAEEWVNRMAMLPL
jgi:hypothetical protein